MSSFKSIYTSKVVDFDLIDLPVSAVNRACNEHKASALALNRFVVPDQTKRIFLLSLASYNANCSKLIKKTEKTYKFKQINSTEEW